MTLSAVGCEFSGAVVNTHSTGSADAIYVSAEHVWIHNFNIDYSRGSGVYIRNAGHCTVEDFVINNAAQGGSGKGTLIHGDVSATHWNLIRNFHYQGCQGDSIEIRGAFATDNYILGGDKGGVINDTVGWGVNETTGADDNHICGPNIHFAMNSLGDINLIGANSTRVNVEQWGKETTLVLTSSQSSLDSHETARANMQTALSAEHTAIAGLIDVIATSTEVQGMFDQVKGVGWTNETLKAIKDAGGGTINVLSATKGAIQVSYAKDGGIVEVVQGDTISIPYGPLGKDITGRRLYFAAKDNLEDATYSIAIKEITAQITDAATFTGTIPLTSAELGIAVGQYYAEIKSRDADGISSPITELKFILKVVRGVM